MSLRLRNGVEKRAGDMAAPATAWTERPALAVGKLGERYIPGG